MQLLELFAIVYILIILVHCQNLTFIDRESIELT